MTLPPLFTCEFCGSEVNPRQIGVWRKVSGWAQNRKAGGTNHIALAEDGIGLACDICIQLARRGLVQEHPTLF
jgi:hypothetical protein